MGKPELVGIGLQEHEKEKNWESVNESPGRGRGRHRKDWVHCNLMSNSAWLISQYLDSGFGVRGKRGGGGGEGWYDRKERMHRLVG